MFNGEIKKIRIGSNLANTPDASSSTLGLNGSHHCLQWDTKQDRLRSGRHQFTTAEGIVYRPRIDILQIHHVILVVCKLIGNKHMSINARKLVFLDSSRLQRTHQHMVDYYQLCKYTITAGGHI